MKFWYIYLLCFYSLFFVLFSRRKEDQRIKTVIQKKKENGEKTKMKALLQTLIGKHCTIHMLDNSLDFGTYYIKAIEDNGLLLEDTKGNTVVANIEYISAVKEEKEPKKKK